MHTQKIELVLPAQLESSAFLRDVSKDVFKHAGYTSQWINRLKLALDELFDNAVQYGSSNESLIYITFFLDENEVMFQVEDEGKGEKRISAEELRNKVKENLDNLSDMSKDSGRGLALIGNFWADELIIEDGTYGGISVTFKKKIIRHEMNYVPRLPLKELMNEGQIQVINLEGGVDTFNFEEKMGPISEMIESLPENGVLILDCSTLEYFNSTFIGQLSSWHKEAQQKHAQILMKNMSPETMRILDLVGLKPLIYSKK